MFKRMQEMQCAAVHCFSSDDHGVPFRAFIVIHNTDRGPALGGCRFLPYSHEQLALQDAMRLAQGMSFKAALADIPFGGGKAVLLEPEQPYDRAALFRWFASCVDSLGGRYITAMDAGTQVSDMDQIAQTTPHVASHSAIGDPSANTARGVFAGIRAALEFRLQKEVSQADVAIQGLGHVGFELTRLLLRAGARVWVADPDLQACDKAAALGARVVATDEITTLAVDVLAPCALGGVLDGITIGALQCPIVAGCANNQLATAECGDQLATRAILYAPDYVINSGGLIYAAGRYRGLQAAQIEEQVDAIYYRLLKIFVAAQSRQAGSHRIAEEQARRILASDHLRLSA